MSYSILFGPYVNTSFSHELMVLRPFVNWVVNTLPHDITAIKTRSDRTFLYDNVDYMFSVKDNVSMGNRREINEQIKEYKTEAIVAFQTLKRDLIVYTQDVAMTGYGQKLHLPIKISSDIFIQQPAKVLFIPDSSISEDDAQQVYRALLERCFDVAVVGDELTRLQDANESSNLVYKERIYEYIIKYMMSADCVICPSSHWTYIANLHQIPVFSWGSTVTRFKPTGDYYFDNRNSSMLAIDETNVKLIMKQFEWFCKTCVED